MLFKPQMPPAPAQVPAAPPNVAGSSPVIHDPASVCSCHHASAVSAPLTREPSRRALPSVSTGAVVAVLLGGVVLTALLSAVAVSAISVAVAAVVLRVLLNSAHSSHRR
ncbi:hypothetical protein ACWGJ2_04485 [Streptomyces sp. NPDC054796]